MTQREAVKVIGDVIANQLGLISEGDDSQIMLTNERFKIPVKNGLYIALSYIGGKAIGNNHYADGSGEGMVEVSQVVMLYEIQVDIMSFNSEARTRKEEVFMALRSFYAEQQMEINTMQIARMPRGFQDISGIEETKYLNRYATTIAVTALLTKEQAVEYYDEFPTPEVHLNE